MFNLGPEKILIILVVALVVLGPDKLPEYARKAGNFMAQVRRMSAGFESQMREAMAEPTSLVTSDPPGSARSDPPADSNVVSLPVTTHDPSDDDLPPVDPTGQSSARTTRDTRAD